MVASNTVDAADSLSARPVVIEVRDLSKSFGKNVAVDSVSFKVFQKEIFGLLGPNGAGKTTIINILSGIVTPDSGTANVLGIDPRQERTTIFKRASVVSGTTGVHNKETPRTVLTYHARLCGLVGTECSERVEELLATFGLGEVSDRNFEGLSSGERMRTLLAKSLVNDPQLLILDEPTLGLDPDAARMLRALLLKLKEEQGISVLLTTHYMHEADELCDRVAFLYGGRILDVGAVEHIKAKEFSKVTLKIKVRLAHRPIWLKNNGYRTLSPVKIAKEVEGEDAIVPELLRLHTAGFIIQSFEVKKPSLEDYFIRMMREAEQAKSLESDAGVDSNNDSNQQEGDANGKKNSKAKKNKEKKHASLFPHRRGVRLRRTG